MRILVTAPYHEQGLLELKLNFGEIVYRSWKSNDRAYNEKELLDLLYETEAEALITEHDEVTAKVINENTHLKFIGVCRGTPSNVDLAAATQHGIPVFYTPARNAQAVVEMFIANTIIFLRQVIPGINWLKERKWEAGAHTSYLQFKGNELAGKTIGVVGFGAIGQLLAKLVESYPCPIQYYDPYVPEDLFPQHKKCTLEELFATSDIVTIHLPVTEETKSLIDRSLFKLMKPHALFVNTARAVTVNRNDLYDVLSTHQIKGAILDVFDNEPPDELDYKIIDLPNVIATPHIAGATFEVEDHHVDILNKALIDWHNNGRKNSNKIYNKEVLASGI
ncbi:2-hydroxyacid dehydrogenase [Niabella insulamsoli]|uniref:2-hydroxyacid dehydrogenase n=1 Tax=Niabella insulamsoli TaxID=3144874 RepID=UPI0031FD428A